VYFRIQADNFVFTVLDNLRAVREDANIGAELMATANSYYYGNGCLLGQSERFKAVRAAKKPCWSQGWRTLLVQLEIVQQDWIGRISLVDDHLQPNPALQKLSRFASLLGRFFHLICG